MDAGGPAITPGGGRGARGGQQNAGQPGGGRQGAGQPNGGGTTVVNNNYYGGRGGNNFYGNGSWNGGGRYGNNWNNCNNNWYGNCNWNNSCNWAPCGWNNCGWNACGWNNWCGPYWGSGWGLSIGYSSCGGWGFSVGFSSGCWSGWGSYCAGPAWYGPAWYAPAWYAPVYYTPAYVPTVVVPAYTVYTPVYAPAYTVATVGYGPALVAEQPVDYLASNAVVAAAEPPAPTVPYALAAPAAADTTPAGYAVPTSQGMAAWSQLNSGDLDRAADAFQGILAADPTDGRALMGQGLAQMLQGNTAQATACFRLAIGSDAGAMNALPVSTALAEHVRKQAEKLWSQPNADAAFVAAVGYSVVNDPQLAFRVASRAVELGDNSLTTAQLRNQLAYALANRN